MTTSSTDPQDTRVRLAVFNWLEEQAAIFGDVIPRTVLAQGFNLDGARVPLLGPQGIFRPAVIPYLPLSICTSPKGPYDDHFGPDDTLRYAYRGTDPRHSDNVRLREAMRRQTPLVYFHGVIPGKYLAIWPVFVVGDDPGALKFTVVADQQQEARRVLEASHSLRYPEDNDARRRYITGTVKARLHQRGFRERVLEAYNQQCALCRLRHPELLEAAHIIPDGEPDGVPIVPNGLSLCRLHHGAFDRFLIGIRPDYTVEVRKSVLEEHDGPMLRHGLQEAHNQRICIPRPEHLRPSTDLLERRYERFLKAG